MACFVGEVLAAPRDRVAGFLRKGFGVRVCGLGLRG